MKILNNSKNVHSNNDKANTIIELIGASCFMSGASMTRLDKKDIPSVFKSCNNVYIIKDLNGREVQQVGFEDKTETMYIINYNDNKIYSSSYDKFLNDFGR